jgi:hypothetical protein
VDQWWSNVDSQWEVPPLARFLERIASFSRLIVLDKRGTGLLDPVPMGGPPALEEWMDDMTEANVAGLAVHIGARIAMLARPSEILVSSTVRTSSLAPESRSRIEESMN